jgi:recombinational DNA repair ATPase RecF
LEDANVDVEVDNVGGIDSCSVSLSSGVTLFEGQNATNRTSLLTAIAGALGGSNAAIKSDADEGSVSLSIDDEEYERQFVRARGGAQTVGAGFTDDPDTVDLFVSLLETNDVRRAVETDTDLYDVIMRPVDTGAIERRVETLKSEKADRQ